MNKLFTEKSKIIQWLHEYNVLRFTLVPDEKYGYVVNVDGNVDLSGSNLTCIPVKFSDIDGNLIVITTN